MQSTTTVTSFGELDSSVYANLFKTALDNSFESVLITEGNAPQGGYPIVYVNQAFTDMTGYSADEIIGKSPAILQGPKTDATVLNRLASDLSAGRAFHGQAVNYRKDGSEFTLEWKVIPVENAQGEVTHLISVQRELK